MKTHTNLSIVFLAALVFSACDGNISETWTIDNLEEIGGHPVIVSGDPEVVETQLGPVVYFDGNGEKELDGSLSYDETIINPVGKVAIGGRMNHIHWFNGYIRTVKVTRIALDPEEFIQIESYSKI